MPTYEYPRPALTVDAVVLRGSAEEAAWHRLDAPPPLAFDHDRIVAAALEACG